MRKYIKSKKRCGKISSGETGIHEFAADSLSFLLEFPSFDFSALKDERRT